MARGRVTFEDESITPLSDGDAATTNFQARVAEQTRQGGEAYQGMRDAQAATDAANAAAARESMRLRQARAKAEADRAHDPQAFAAGTIDAADKEFGQVFDAMGQRNPSYEVARAGYAPTKRYTDTMQGLLGEAPDLMAQRQNAELQQAITARDVTAEMGAQQAQLLAQAQARQVAEADRIDAGRRTVVQAATLSRKAADAFAKSADTDSAGWFANAGVGTKIAASLSAGLLGFAGMDPFSHIRAAIQDEQNDVNSARERLRASTQMASEGVAEARGAYGDLLGQIGDERVAKLAHENAVMQGLQTQMATRLQTAGLHTMNAEQQELFNQFGQQIADNERQIGLLAAGNTPTRVVGGGPRYNAGQQKLLGKVADASLKDRSAAREGIAAEAGAERAAGRTADLETAKAQREGSEKLVRGPHGVLTELEKFDGRVGVHQGVVGLIEQMEKKYQGKDIPGVSAGAGVDFSGRYVNPFGGSESAGFDSEVKAIQEAMGRALSQGAITTDELENFEAYLQEGLFLGGDDRFRQNLSKVKEMFNSRILSAERTLSPEARTYYHRNKDIGDIGARPGAGAVGSTDPVNRDE